MPTLLEDLERIYPGLWTDFASQAEDDVSQWKLKLNGAVPCLDRDWRKLVFTLFDYAASNQGLVKKSFRSNGHSQGSVQDDLRASCAINTDPEVHEASEVNVGILMFTSIDIDVGAVESLTGRLRDLSSNGISRLTFQRNSL